MQRWVIKANGAVECGVNPGQSVEIGRRPLRPLAEDGRRRVDIEDSTRSMSKRHALFSVTASGSAVIRDLGSTNGTYLVGSNGELQRLTEGRDYTLPDSLARVQLGDVPVDFVKVVEEAEDDRPAVPDLFDYARGNSGAEPEMAQMSVDDILDLRAGEPTMAINSEDVANRIKKLMDAQNARTRNADARSGAQTDGAQARDSSPSDAGLQSWATEGNGREYRSDNAGSGNDGANVAANGDTEYVATPEVAGSETISAFDGANPVRGMAERAGDIQQAAEDEGSKNLVGATAASDAKPDADVPVSANADVVTSADAASISASTVCSPIDGLSLPVAGGSAAAQSRPRDLFRDAFTDGAPSDGASGSARSSIQSFADSRSQRGESAAGRQGSGARVAGTAISSARPGSAMNQAPSQGSVSATSPQTEDSATRPVFTYARPAQSSQSPQPIQQVQPYGSPAEAAVSRSPVQGESVVFVPMDEPARQPAASDRQVSSNSQPQQERYSRFMKPQDADMGENASRPAETDSFTPVFEPGSVFEKVSKGEFNHVDQAQAVEVDGFTSEQARRSGDFTEQFKMASYHELQPFLAMNPNLYDDLYAWLTALGNRDVDAALARNPGYAQYCDRIGKERQS